MKTKLQIMREKKGLTVEQLACLVLFDWLDDSYLGAVKRTIRHTELGVKFLIATKWQKGLAEHIAQTLGCSIDELVED
ncbi:XRE family transcriptional regulator [Lactococcus garvieae]|uniref:XRE family transcriptional regulator n=1 Tax=Lactococcus garvieae TaxID=1363 RepID=UPI00385489AD